jgi:hypothetical protein
MSKLIIVKTNATVSPGYDIWLCAGKKKTRLTNNKLASINKILTIKCGKDCIHITQHKRFKHNMSLQIELFSNIIYENIHMYELISSNSKIETKGNNRISNMYLESAELINNGILNINAQYQLVNSAFTNNGTWNHSGLYQTDKNIRFINHGTINWKNVTWRFNANPLQPNTSHGTWNIDNVNASDDVYIHSFSVVNLKNSKMHFSWLIGRQIVFHSGQYHIMGLQNYNTITCCNNNWTITDDLQKVYSDNYIYSSGFGPQGAIESTHDLYYSISKPLFKSLAVIKTKGNLFICNPLTSLTELKSIQCEGVVKATINDNVNNNEQINYPCNLDCTVNGNFINHGSLHTLSLKLNIKGKFINGKDNQQISELFANNGNIDIQANDIDNSYGKIYGKKYVTLVSQNNILNGFAKSGGAFVNTYNGAFISSDDYISLYANNEIINKYGILYSNNSMRLIGKTKISNIAGKILSGGNILFKSIELLNSRDIVYQKSMMNWSWAYSGCWQYAEISDMAIIQSMNNITFNVKNGTNLASTILAQKSILYCSGSPSRLFSFLTKYTVTKPNSFNSIGRDNWGYGCNDKCGYQQSCSPFSSYPSILRSGESITITTNEFQFSGTMNSPLIKISANTSACFNTNYARSELIQKDIIVDITELLEPLETIEYLNNHTYQLENDRISIISKREIKSMIDFKTYSYIPRPIVDLALQQLMSIISGRIIHDKQILTDDERKVLYIPAKEINPYVSSGDISGDKFQCHTTNNQKYNNIRLVTNDNIDIKSKGDVEMTTQSYTVEYNQNNTKVVEQRAMPQMQCVSKNITVETEKKLVTTATLLKANNNLTLKADKILDSPLVCQKTTTIDKQSNNPFNSNTHIETNVNHTVLSSKMVGANVIKIATSSIDQIATSDIANDTLTYDSPSTNVDGLIVVDTFSSNMESSNGFTNKTSSNYNDTPNYHPAIQKANVICYKGKNTKLSGVSIFADKIEDHTIDGCNFQPIVKTLSYFSNNTVESALANTNVGCRGWYETMLPCQLIVKKIIRMIDNDNKMRFQSVNGLEQTEIIGRFIQTTYELKQWHDEWFEHHQLIPDEALVIVALAISYATMGTGASGLGASLFELSGLIGTVTSAAFTTICTIATYSFLRTGDPIKTGKQLLTMNTVKELAISCISVGLCDYFNIVPPNVLDTPFIEYLKYNLNRSLINIPLQCVIGRQDISKTLKSEATNCLINTCSMYTANQIGTYREDLSYFEHKLCHGLLGGIFGGITNSMTDSNVMTGIMSGAMGSVLGEIAMEESNINNIQKRMFMSKMLAGTSALVCNLDPSIAISTASISVENNALPCIMAALAAYGLAYTGGKILKASEEECIEDALYILEKDPLVTYSSDILIGVKTSITGLIDTICSPLEYLIYPMSKLISDQLIIMNYYDDKNIENNIDNYVNYINARNSMNDRYRSVKDQLSWLTYSSNTHDKVQLLSSLTTSALIGGYSATGFKMMKNYYKYNMFDNPPIFHPRLRDEYVSGLPEIKLYSSKDIRSIQDYRSFIYTISENGQLSIARSSPEFRNGRNYVTRIRTDKYGRNESYKNDKLFHQELGFNRPVITAGELSTQNGRITSLNNSSGGYLPNGSHLHNLTERIFQRHGFNEVHGLYDSFDWYLTHDAIRTHVPLSRTPNYTLAGLTSIFNN